MKTGSALKRKSPTKRKAESLATMRRRCDRLMQEIGRRNNPYCFICGKPTKVMHHYIAKSVCARLRYDWDNLIPLCNGCHNRLHPSGDPHYEHTIEAKKGKEWYDTLQMRRREEVRPNVGYYKAILALLEGKERS